MPNAEPLSFNSERDTCVQLIGTFDEVIALVRELCASTITWEDATKRLPLYDGKQDE